MIECTEYIQDDAQYEETWKNLCRCPVCKGWLPQYFPERFNCKKCGAELMLFPDVVDGEELYSGRICPISEVKQ
jgi:hypothetical protein